MKATINPQLPYYLLLFTLTIVLRCIRAYRNRPQNANPTVAEARAYRASYLFFGFELVNVAAGVFILLSQHASQFVGTVMILYVILVIFSFFIEENGVGIRVRTAGHVAVSAIILGVTLTAFLGIDGLKGDAGSTPGSGGDGWVVAMPYFDATLNRNFGVKVNPIQSSWVTEVSAPTREAAIQIARQRFRSDSGPRPFFASAERTVTTLVIADEAIVVERRAIVATPH